MRYHLVAFASDGLAGARWRIASEARASGWFSTVQVLRPRDLNERFWRERGDTVAAFARGYGLWTWKPYVIAQRLDALPDGDALVYVDAGCSFGPTGRQRLDEYVSLAAANPLPWLAFALPFTIGQYTKRQLLEWFGVDDAATREAPQLASGAFVIIAGAAARAFAWRWYDVMGDPALIDDATTHEHGEFVEHRHDQSVFTLLARADGAVTVPDESAWYGAWHERGRYPIHARRWRHRLPWPAVLLRFAYRHRLRPRRLRPARLVAGIRRRRSVLAGDRTVDRTR